MPLTIEQLKEKRLPPDFDRDHERRLPAAKSTVYENMLRLCSALEDDRLTGVDPGLRGSVATLVAAMGRERDLRYAREAAEERSAELLAPENDRLRRQLASSCRALGVKNPGNARRAEEARELLQYVGAGLGIEPPELEITDAQRANVRAVEQKTGAAWRDFRERDVRIAAAKLMVTEQLKHDAAQKGATPETVEARARQLAASGAFRAMCDRMPEGALHEAVEAKDAVGLVGAFASELGRERHAEKPAAPSREPDAPRMTR